MAYQIRNLIEGHQDVVYVESDAPLSLVVKLMLKNDFSQIPVVEKLTTKSENLITLKPVGIITTDDVLQAMENFDCQINELNAHNAMRTPATAMLEDDIFDLFDVIAKRGAVIITDAQENIASIVTAADIVEFFKQQTIDSLYLEDIESSVKEFITYRFLDKDGKVIQEDLDKAIERIHSSIESIKDNYKKAVGVYLSASGETVKKIDLQAIEKSFTKLGMKKELPSFDDLTFNEYVQLLTDSERWVYYQRTFKMNGKSVRKRLESIRDIRNQLAHYRGEITYTQRKQLESTLEWLNLCQTNFEEEIEGEQAVAVSEIDIEPGEIIASDEMASSKTSKYSSLGDYLRKIPGPEDKIKLTFAEIENILGSPLPPSAFISRSWWANDTVGHVQSQEWLDAGWRVGYRNLSAKTVDFSRIKAREKQYIVFFAAILKELREQKKMPVKEVSSPNGQSWITINGAYVNGTQKSIFVAAFASANRYRIELYIDTDNYEINKKVFDELHSAKSEIEAQVGDNLSWERLSDKRASRIALYQDGSITQSEEELTRLINWTVEKFPIFFDAMNDRAEQSLSKHLPH